MSNFSITSDRLVRVTDNWIKNGEIRQMWARELPFGDEWLGRDFETNTGGEYIQRKYKDASTVSASNITRVDPFGLGLEATQYQTTKPFEAMRASRAIIIAPVVATMTHKIVQAGGKQPLDLVKESISDTQRLFVEMVQNQTTKGDQVQLRDLNTLNGDDYADGFLEGAAVGSQDNVVNLFNKGSIPTLPGGQNQFLDCSGAFSSNFEHGTRILLNRARHARLAGDRPPNHRWYITPAVAENWINKIAGRMSYVNANPYVEAAKAPVEMEFSLHGVPARQVYDVLPQAGTATATKKWSALLINQNDVGFIPDAGYKMKMYPWKDVPTAPDLSIMWIVLSGQNWIDSWGQHGVVVDAETY